jgi:hypothetical protein
VDRVRSLVGGLLLGQLRWVARNSVLIRYFGKPRPSTEFTSVLSVPGN